MPIYLSISSKKKMTTNNALSVLGIHFFGNYFFYFFIFGKHKESWLKKLNFGQ